MTTKFMRGFETGNLLEVTASSGASITTGAKFSGDYGCQLTTGGYVYWDFSPAINFWETNQWQVAIKQPVGTGTISIMKIDSPLNNWELKAEYSGGVYTLHVYRAAVEVTYGYTAELPSSFLQSDQWERIIMTCGGTTRHIFVNGVEILTFGDVDWAVITNKTITRLTITAGTSTMYVDDVALYASEWFGHESFSSREHRGVYHLAAIPLRPHIDTNIVLSRSGAGPTQNSGALSDADAATYVYLSETDGKQIDSYMLEDYLTQIDTYYSDWKGTARIPIVHGSSVFVPYTSPIETAVMTHVISLQTVGTDGTVNVDVHGGSISAIGPEHALTTSYQCFTDITTIVRDETWENNAQQLEVNLSHNYPATTREIRTHTLVVCVLAYLLETSSYTTSEDSFKISFDLSASQLATEYLKIQTNVKASPYNRPLGLLSIKLLPVSSAIVIQLSTSTIGWSAQYSTNYPVAEPVSISIILHGQFISFYFNDRWQTTFPFAKVINPDTLSLSASSDGTVTLTNIVKAEISDWREAIWIEYDMSGDNVIQSIIQERPIIRACKSDGSISYFMTPPSMTPTQIVNIGQHSLASSYDGYKGSDALVYYKDVKSAVDETALQQIGFHTSVIQLSSLDSGAVRAAKRIMRVSLESMEKHILEARLDLRVEEGDTVQVAYTASGAGETEDANIYVEDKSITITEEGGMRMTVSGRAKI